MKIRPSMRTTYRRCPRAFWFRWFGGIEPARGRRALVTGTAYHAGLEALRLTGDVDDAVAIARSRYRREADDGGMIADETTEIQLVAYVSGYAARFAQDDAGVKVTEAKVFDDGDPEGGTADCVVRYPNGEVWLVEDKTTSRFDDETAMRLALLRNDQITTYVAALRRRGIPVLGCLYRQCLKTGTKITQKETPTDYHLRIVGIYNDECLAKFREIRVVWTDAQLAAARAESHALNRQIRRQAPKPLDRWPSNPLSCIGPYGPCEFLNLCATGTDPARAFKPSKEGHHDDGKFQREIWGISRGAGGGSEGLDGSHLAEAGGSDAGSD